MQKIENVIFHFKKPDGNKMNNDTVFLEHMEKLIWNILSHDRYYKMVEPWDGHWTLDTWMKVVYTYIVIQYIQYTCQYCTYITLILRKTKQLLLGVTVK